MTWQRFCQIPLGGRVPHPTTLMRSRSAAASRRSTLNEALLAKAREAKVLKTNRLCGHDGGLVSCQVVPSNIL